MAWRILFTFVIQVLGGNYSSIEQVNSIYKLLAYSLITRTKVDIREIIYSDLVTKLLNKSRLKYVSYPRFISYALQVLLGSKYTQVKNFGVLPPILSNSNFTKDPSKITYIELAAHMIVVNNQRDLVSPPPLAEKPKKGKHRTYPQDLERDIQLASTGLPSTLNEGTRKSKPFPESTATHPKDSGGNKQHLDKDITSITPDECMAKTTLHPEGSLGDKDSGGYIPPANMKPIHTLVADSSGTCAKKMSRVLFNRMNEKQWEEHKEAAVSYASLKASIEEYYEENIAHQGQTDQLVASSMSSLDKRSSSISDLYKGLNVITKLLKDINNAIKDDPTTNKKIDEAIKTFAKISTQTTKILSLVKTFDFSTLQSTMQDLQAHALKQEEALAAWKKSSTNMAWNLGSRMTVVEISQTALKHEVSSLRQDTLEIKSIMAEIYQAFKESSQATLRIDKGKRIATESKEYPLKKLVPASTIIHPNLDEPVRVKFVINGKIIYLAEQEIQEYYTKEEKMKKAAEEIKLLAMSRPELINVIRKEAKKLIIDPKEAISTTAGETSKKAQNVEHEVLKREHSKKVKRKIKLNKRRAKEYM
nr:hypothetical protein [Tanacetum cinerariifolium]